MRKLTMLGLSLLLSIGAYAAPQAVKAQKASASSNATETVLKAKGLESERTRHAGVKGVVEQKVGMTRPVTRNAKSPAKSAVTTDKIYAGMIYPDAVLGGGKINVATGTYTPIYSSAGVHAIGVNPDLGEIYSVEYNTTSSGVSLAGLRYAAYDLTTGALKREVAVADQEAFDLLPQRGCYVPTENAIYGYSNAGWVKVDCATLTPSLVAESSEFPFAITFNSNTQQVVALVHQSGKFYLGTVDMATGAITVGAQAISVTTGYLGGFAYDYSSDSYLFNPNDDYTSEIVSIDANTLAVTTLCELPGAPETGAIYVDEVKPADPLAPKAPEFIGSSFPKAELTGQVTFKMPSMTVDNAALSGNLTYVVSVNGTQLSTGSAAPGSEVVVNAVNMAQGVNTFTCTAASGTHVSKACTEDVYVGNDTPATPKNVVLTPVTVSWDPVTVGAHKGYLDLSKLTYTVTINGSVVAEDITATSCATNLPVNVEIQNYVAKVVAKCNGMTSEPGSSNDITFGQPFNLPVSFEPTDEEADLFTVIDNNNDGTAWTFSPATSTSAAYFKIAYNARYDMDDYLILPPVNVTNIENLYKFSFNAWAGSASYPEKVEVWIGRENTAEAMTTKILDTVVLDTRDVKNLFANFQFTETGKWYVGIKGVSDKDMLALYVNDFNLTPISAMVAGPAAIDVVKVVPGDKGALNAEVTFSMPTKTNSGQTLDVTKDISVSFETLVDLQTVTGKPGSEHKVTVATVQGANTIDVSVACDGVQGMPSTIDVYTGVEIPAGVVNFVMTPSQDNYGISLKFDAPEAGVDGGYINQSDLTYTLYQEVVIGEFWGIPITSWQPIADLGSNTQIEGALLDEGTALGSYTLGVAATNEAGTGSIVYSSVVLGKPYEMPVIEDLGKGSVTYQPLMLNTQGGMKYNYYTAAGIEQNYGEEYATKGAAICATGTDNQYGYWFLPAVCTKGASKAAFELSYYVGACENVIVYAETYGVEREEIFNQANLFGYDETGFQTLPIMLPAKFLDKDWVNITIRCEFSNQHNLFVWNGYRMINMVQKDMAALEVSAPKKVANGAEYTVSVKVANYGMAEAADYAVELYADGEKVAEKTGSDLASYADATFEFTQTMSPVAEDAISYYAVVKQSGDAGQANNQTATIEVAPKASKLPGATALTAGNSDGAVALTWDEPNMDDAAPEEITQDFEDGDAFAAEYGEWVFVDVDDSEVGGFQNMDIPGITPGETKGSFWIWDQSVLGNQTFEAHSGTKYLFSLFRYDDGQADEWAISPELFGKEQTISFYARSYSAEYPEAIEVWYSTGSTDPKDFVQIAGAGDEVVPAEWTLYQVDVPDGAKRFAIRSCATSSFMLMVDDVTFTPAGVPVGDLQLKGYDVYRDGVKISSALVEETAYADANVVAGTEYTYVVVAVFEEGDGKMSNKATIKYDPSGLASIDGGKLVAAGKGEIVVKGFDGEMLLITAADGKIIAKGVATDMDKINVPAGIYVVKAGNKSVKVVVR